MGRVGAFGAVFLLGAVVGGSLFARDGLPTVTYTQSVGVATTWTGEGLLVQVPDWDVLGPVLVVGVLAVLVVASVVVWRRRVRGGPAEPGGPAGPSGPAEPGGPVDGNGSGPHRRWIVEALRSGTRFSRKPGSR
jgi:hypothetical protein